jgi:hypothetical protein
MLALAAPADALRRLHVDALGMRADRNNVAVGQVFHLAIHVRVRESIAALDELVVPDVGGLQLEGDERHVTRTSAGTDIVETLTLEATAAGRYTLRGAYVDAIDARNGKPTRFSADPITIVVGQPGYSYEGAARLVWRAFLAVVVLAALGGATVLIIRARARRQRAAPAEPFATVVAPPPPVRTPRDAVAEALREFRRAPEPPALLRLRAALFAAAGAHAGATLRDALRSADGRLRAALVTAERAVFGPATARADAAAELVRATEAWLA